MKTKYVWYASYGSNLNEKRFNCYIQGGTPEGSTIEEVGCTDKTPPKAIKNVMIPYPLYFAGVSERWGKGGMGFIGSGRIYTNKTLGRMYLITEEQFKEVVKQENRRMKDRIGDYNLFEVKRKGSHEILDNGYGLILYLGDKDGYPIFTFTTPNPNRMRNKPSLNYLKMFALGYQEAYGMKQNDIIKYLLTKEGIKGNYTASDLKLIWA